jgi:hypothetical protein
MYDEAWKSQQFPIRRIRSDSLYKLIDSTKRRRPTTHNVYRRRRPGFHLYSHIPEQQRRIPHSSHLRLSKKCNHPNFCCRHLHPWVHQMIQNFPRNWRECTVMWLLSLSVFIAAMSVWFRDKKTELPLVSISTALLFALPNIRNSQPGVPTPVGTTEDSESNIILS